MVWHYVNWWRRSCRTLRLWFLVAMMTLTMRSRRSILVWRIICWNQLLRMHLLSVWRRFIIVMNMRRRRRNIMRNSNWKCRSMRGMRAVISLNLWWERTLIWKRFIGEQIVWILILWQRLIIFWFLHRMLQTAVIIRRKDIQTGRQKYIRRLRIISSVIRLRCFSDIRCLVMRFWSRGSETR